MHYMLTFKSWMKKLREARKMSQPDLHILPTEYILIYKILSDHPNWQVLPGSDWSVFAYVRVTGKVKVWGMGYLMAVFLIRITPKDSSALTRMDVLPCLHYCTQMALHPHPPFPKSSEWWMTHSKISKSLSFFLPSLLPCPCLSPSPQKVIVITALTHFLKWIQRSWELQGPRA